MSKRSQPQDKPEVLIVGAGLAGLGCAQALLQRGIKSLILEAKDRVGGRVFSKRQPLYSPPIEYGAEYLHGVNKNLMDLLGQRPFVDVQDTHLYFSDGKLQEKKDFWERFEKYTSLLNKNLKEDRSVSEFFKAQGKKIPPEWREILFAYVEGFHAANADLMGEKALASAEQSEEEELNGQGLFRILEGNSFLLTKLQENLDIRLQNRVSRIQRLKDRTEVIALTPKGPQAHMVRFVVLTVPLGVLKNENPLSHIEVSPPIPEIPQALESLHMGHIQRISFVFKERFWETLSTTPISFIHLDAHYYFPTWWTQSPVRSPVLVAWQGGPKAEEMSAWTKEQRVQAALKTLSAFSKKSVRFLRDRIESVHTHNWSHDPFVLGAYSYTGISRGRRHDFRKPFADYLWIAGEATAKDADQGTMQGALESGYSVAEQIAALL